MQNVPSQNAEKQFFDRQSYYKSYAMFKNVYWCGTVVLPKT